MTPAASSPVLQAGAHSRRAPRRPWRRPVGFTALGVLCVLAFSGCAEEKQQDEEVTPAAVLEIIGTYRDDYGYVHQITASNWNDGFSNFAVLNFDNAADYLVAQNGAGNSFNPNLFSRFDWTVSGGQLYYCQATYDAPSAAVAEANTSADRSDLVSGCDGFSWTSLVARVMANRVIAYSPELPSDETLGAGFYNAALSLGLPGGSTDVVSLGDDGSDEGGTLTLGVGASGDPTRRVCIVDDGTPAADFVVFENPFAFTDANGAANFTEAAYVEVSEDGVNFHRFAATAPNPPDEAIATLVGNPANYGGLAGIRTLAEGGDIFDLGALISTHELPANFKGCYVRVVDGGAALADYDRYGALKTESPSGADIDAVEALHYEADATLAP